MNLRRAAIAAIFAAGALVSGCETIPPGGAKIYPAGTSVSKLPGLLAEEGSGPSVRYVFITHGMGPTKEDFGDTLLDRLAADAGYARSWNGGRGEGSDGWIPVQLPKPYRVSGEALKCAPGAMAEPCRFTTFGGYKIDTFQRGAKTIHVYRYFWQASLQKIEDPFIVNDNNVDRSLVNGGLKKQLVNYGFSDAAAYLGPIGNLMRAGTEGAVCTMMRDSLSGGRKPPGPCAFATLAGQPGPGFDGYRFVSMSLGSRILLDTLDPAYDPTHSVTGRTNRAIILRNTDAFYMLANQLPLLGLGRLNAGPEGEPMAEGPVQCFGCSPFEAINKVREDEHTPSLDWPKLDTLHVVSFQDPEDLLGFRLSDNFAEPEDSSIRFTQVVHRNVGVRGLLGFNLFAMPAEAHASELKQDTSAALILCGGKVEEGGRLVPITACLRR